MPTVRQMRSSGDGADLALVSWRCLAGVLTLALLGACAARDREPPEPAPRVPAEVVEERRYLVSPHLGYSLVPDPDAASLVDEAHEALLAGDSAAAARIASDALEASPGYAPALVVEAQRHLVAREYGSGLELLTPIAARHPGYTAAQLLRGRTLEKLGRVPAAYGAYRQVAPDSEIAASRAESLRSRAIEIVERRIDDALSRRRIDEAEESLTRLREWAPDSIATWEVAARVAAAADSPGRELAAVRRLHEFGADDPETLERLADLELEVGDTDRALEMYRSLHRRFPDDERLREQLERAEFRWRLGALPEKVQEKAASVQLDRGDYATLLYWLLPSVRAANPGPGRVATDVVDHPDRREIIRTLNLGLLEMDETLHEFQPERPIRRADVFESLLVLMSKNPPRPSCLDGVSMQGNPSISRVCGAAARCGFIPEPGDCLAGAGVSGEEAVEWIRRTFALTRGS